MDAAAIRTLLPLGKGKLRDFRKEVRSQAVMSAAAKLTAGEHFTTLSLQAQIQDVFRFALPVEVIANECNRLVDAKIFSRTENPPGFTATDIPDNRGYSVLIRDLKGGFARYLRENGVEFDPAIDRDIEIRFVQAAEALVSELVNALKRGDTTGWAASSASVRSAILRPWDEPKLARLQVLFESYIQADRPELNEFILAIFETAVTVDLLRRGRGLEGVLKEAGRPTRIYLDTNALSALLCKSNRYHEVIRAGVRLAIRYGFEVGFIAPTREELNRLLRNANKEIREGNAAEASKWNEFVLEFARYSRGEKWSDAYARLLQWPTWLKEECNIVQFEEPREDLPEETRRVFNASYQGALRYAREYRDPEVMRHDFRLYSAVALSKQTEDCLFDGPLALTLDRFFCATDAYLVENEGRQPCIIHATAWLEVTSQFLDADFADESAHEVARAVLLNLVRPSEPSLSIDEYAKLLSAKEDWEPKRAGLLARILVESVQREEIEDALRDGDLERAGRHAQDALANTGLVREIIGRESAERDAEDLRERIKVMGVELEAQRTIARMFSQALSRPIVVQVKIEGISAQAIGMFDQLRDEFLKKLPEAAIEAGLDSFDWKKLDAEGLRAALRKVQSVLRGLKDYTPTAAGLLLVAQKIAGLL